MKNSRGLVSLASVLSLITVGCGTWEPGSYEPIPGDRCPAGETTVAACSPVACSPGYVRGYACGPDGIYSGCTCILDPNRGDAGTVQDSGVTTTVCAESATRTSSCRTCPSGQVAYETCRSNAWTACTCVPDHGNGTNCIPNSVTMNSCMTCATGYIAQQRCASDGRSYAPCECVQNGSPQTCVPQSVRNACNPCANGTAAGTEWCNEQGTGYVCRINSGATCSGGSPQTCTPGVSRGTACTFGCTSGTAAGTEFCNSAGNGYECRQNSGTTCSGGSTGGGGSCRTQPYTLIMRAVNTSLRVRCWDMNGNPVTSTTNELRVTMAGGCGYNDCVDGTGEGSSFVESGFWSTSRSESATIRFDLISVEGREDSLRNQQGMVRICPDGGRSKARVAANIDRLNAC